MEKFNVIFIIWISFKFSLNIKFIRSLTWVFLRACVSSWRRNALFLDLLMSTCLRIIFLSLIYLYWYSRFNNLFLLCSNNASTNFISTLFFHEINSLLLLLNCWLIRSVNCGHFTGFTGICTLSFGCFCFDINWFSLWRSLLIKVMLGFRLGISSAFLDRFSGSYVEIK